MTSDHLTALTEKIIASAEGIDRATALALAAGAPQEALLAAAERVRQHIHEDRVRRCAIVNARAGSCSEDCRFCAQSARYSTQAPTHPLLDLDQILAQAREAKAAGVHCFGIVTAGRKPSPDEMQRIIALVRACVAEGLPGVGLSLGILERSELEALHAAGARHYNHNLETSRRFYPEICTTHDWDERYRTVQTALEVGFEVCCGGIFGLSETWEDRVDMALSLRELGVDNVPINFLNPVAGTPLGDTARLAPDEALRVVALYRLLLPSASLSICGGRPQILGEQQDRIFAAGANGLMTGNYLTTTGITYADDLAMIAAQGLR